MQKKRTERSHLWSLCFSALESFILLSAILATGLFALTFLIDIPVEFVVRGALFAAGIIGFVIFWNFLREYFGILRTTELMTVGIRIIFRKTWEDICICTKERISVTAQIIFRIVERRKEKTKALLQPHFSVIFGVLSLWFTKFTRLLE